MTGAGWANWAGNVRAAAEVRHPADLEALRGVLREAAAAAAPLRCAGAGHSFTPLVQTEGYVVGLAAFGTVLDVDRAARQAWVGAGARIAELGGPLWSAGLSLPNQGDIDVQTIGGAVATGTHGTGATLPCLSAAVDAVRLVLADGTEVVCDRRHEPELFEAARLSLGAVGVVTALRLQLVDAYHLHERTWLAPTDELLAGLDDAVAATRHFEFFWLPETDRCFAKALASHPGPPDPMDDHRFERVGPAHAIFPSVRADRFVEMEFAVPAAAGPACFTELRELVLGSHPQLRWPIEYRTLAADDTWLGPASGRPSVTLSVHEGVERDHRRFFADAEAVFRRHGGRPHWGKLHGFGADELAAAVPGWARFWSVADEVDPDRRLRGPYLSAWRP